MKFRKILICLFVFCFCTFFLASCEKKSDNVSIDELREIIEKDETNYTFKLSVSESAMSYSMTYKLESVYDEFGEITLRKIMVDNDNHSNYYVRDSELETYIHYKDNKYVAEKRDYLTKLDTDEMSLFRDLILLNLDLFSYDNSKYCYTAVLTKEDDGQIRTMNMKLKVSNGHLIYFEAYDLLYKTKMIYEFSDYGKTKVKLPTYYTADGEVIYAEGEGQITELIWNNYFDNIPKAYTIKMETNSPDGDLLNKRIISVDYSSGQPMEIEEIDRKQCIFTIIDNQSICIYYNQGIYCGEKCEREFCDYLSMIHSNYLTSFSLFEYHNESAGYSANIDGNTISFQFEDDKLTTIIIENDQECINYSFIYQREGYIRIPEYELVE